MLYSLNTKVLCKITQFHKGGFFSSRHHLHSVFQSVSEGLHSGKCVAFKPMPVFSNISIFKRRKQGRSHVKGAGMMKMEDVRFQFMYL